MVNINRWSFTDKVDEIFGEFLTFMINNLYFEQDRSQSKINRQIPININRIRLIIRNAKITEAITVPERQLF
ncbi:hypothetical protein D1BOALGB6SA_6264 [Olavius sp. associated proteobacterium Delta 1]|nr:hypothetical protein D1BOALGB6SA_6264 [Olavius sp. associated proteobacterium Delta 1]